MTKWKNVAAALCLAVLGQGAAQAAEITVVGGMGVISGIRDLAAGFESATGNKSMRCSRRTSWPWSLPARRPTSWC
jgi:hypothetical protein